MSEDAEVIPLPERIVRTRFGFMPVPVPVDGDAEVANMLWIRAVRAEAQRRGITLAEPVLQLDPVPHPAAGLAVLSGVSARPRRATPPPDPALARSSSELIKAMRQLRRWSGSPQPTLRELADRSNELGRPVSRATLGRALSGAAWPSMRTLTGFVLACGVSDKEWRAWAAAWVGFTDAGTIYTQNRAVKWVGPTTVALLPDFASGVHFLGNEVPPGMRSDVKVV